MRNILISALNKDADFCDFVDENNEFHEKYNNATEAVAKYLIYKLEGENQTLDYIFLFVRKEDLEYGNYERFKNIFPQIPTDYIVLNNGLIKENFALAPEMNDKIIEYKNSTQDDVEITINLSDGFEFNSIFSSLIQLIKYNELNIKRIFYLNKKNYSHIIEEVSEIININSLINGANEFFSFGSADKIQEFFAQDNSNENIKNLTEKMMGLSETLKICGSYNAVKKNAQELANAAKDYEKSLDVKLNNLLNKTSEISTELKDCSNFETAEEILKKLNNAIDEYKEALNKKESVNLSEFYFSKLWPKIKEEYDAVLPKENVKQSQIDIIRWSIKTGFIQQAVVFFTEWIPDFLVNEKYIELNKHIEEECIRRGQNFSSWPVYFFRAYPVKINKKQLSVEEIKEIFKNNNKLEVIQNAVKGQNEKLDNFLKNIHGFSSSCKTNAVKNLTSLNSKHSIRKLIEFTKKQKLTYETYVKAMFKNVTDVESELTNRLSSLEDEHLKEMFGLTNNDKDKKSTDSQTRAEMMNDLIENNLLFVNINKISKDDFLEFMGNYDWIVQYFRNKIAHAVLNNKAILKQDEFIEKMEKSLDLIKEK